MRAMALCGQCFTAWSHRALELHEADLTGDTIHGRLDHFIMADPEACLIAKGFHKGSPAVAQPCDYTSTGYVYTHVA